MGLARIAEMVNSLWQAAWRPTPTLSLLEATVALVVGALLNGVSPAAGAVRRLTAWCHELGHATASLVVGGRVDGLRLARDGSGATVSRLAVHSPSRLRRVLVAGAGYPAPALVGLGAAVLVAVGLAGVAPASAAVAVVVSVGRLRGWLTAVVAAAVGAAGLVTLVWLSPWLTAFVVTVVVGALVVSAVAGVAELSRTRARSGSHGDDDASTLASLTGVSGTVWVAVFVVAVVLAGAGVIAVLT